MCPYDPSKSVCKRVAAVAGDRIDINKNDFRSAGPRLAEVPPGHCWLLGDNAANSLDSRKYGFVSEGLIRGRVLYKLRLSPPFFQGIGSLEEARAQASPTDEREQKREAPADAGRNGAGALARLISSPLVIDVDGAGANRVPSARPADQADSAPAPVLEGEGEAVPRAVDREALLRLGAVREQALSAGERVAIEQVMEALHQAQVGKENQKGIGTSSIDESTDSDGFASAPEVKPTLDSNAASNPGPT